MSQSNLQFDINTHSLLRAVILIGVLYTIYRLHTIAILLFVAFLFAVAVNPIVAKFQSVGVRRSLAIPFVYLSLVSLFTVTLAAIVPPLYSQGISLLERLDIPPVLTQNFNQYNLQELEVFSRQLGSIPKIASAISTTFSSILVIVTFSIISYYILIEMPHFHHHLTRFFGRNKNEKQIETFIQNVQTQVGGWVRGELMLMGIVGLATYIGLMLLGVPYALPLALIAALLEIIPNIGPTISALPAIVVGGLSRGSLMAIAVTILYILVQQLENNFFVPQIMRKTVGIHPLVTIILILIGLELKSVVGAVLAIPLFLTVKVAYNEWSRLKHPGDALTQVLKQ